MEFGLFALLWRILRLLGLRFGPSHVLVLTLRLDIVVYNLRGSMFGIYESVSLFVQR